MRASWEFREIAAGIIPIREAPRQDRQNTLSQAVLGIDKDVHHLLASAAMARNVAISLPFSIWRRALLGLVVALYTTAISGCASTGVKDVQKSQTRLDLAKHSLNKGELDEAEAEARKALEYDAESADAYHVLGLVDLLRAQTIQRLLEIDECLTGAEAEVMRAERAQHLEAALRHLSRATELQSTQGEAWASQGTVVALLGRHGEAVEHFKRALSLPASLRNIALVRANLGWAYFHNDEPVAAAKELLQASQFQPGMCVATYRLGRVYFARKEWEKALQKFRDVAGPLECPIQDAHLFAMKTSVELGVIDDLPELGQICVAMAPRSCVAAECRALAASVSTSLPDGP